MPGFRHEALLYAGEREFLEGTAAFVRDGVALGEPTLVVVPQPKLDRLVETLGTDGDHVYFADMAAVGANPARIIPAWHEFVDAFAAPGRRLRGIGEPIGPDRGAAELAECHRHESLLNLAFADAEDFWLLCPYDTEALDGPVVDEACRNHPYIVEGEATRDSSSYGGLDEIAAPFADPLTDPPVTPFELTFDGDELGLVRRAVAEYADRARLSMPAANDLLIATNEVATNSVTHGGGEGLLRIWRDAGSLICEVRDEGHIADPLVGRRRPIGDAEGGFGLWLANQLCDLVQVRTTPGGSVVRLHTKLGG